MSYEYTYVFPALRGLQAGREYYVAMCPLRLLPRIFLFDEGELPPELRAQRSLNLARIPDICKYILTNRDEYAFSAITASIDGQVRFEPTDDAPGAKDIGRLVVPMSARFVINDGQHRRAAIEAAMQEDNGLGEETIAVVFYIDAGLKRSQQLFADLNQHAVRPTKSIGVLYDNRSPLASLSRELTKIVPCFHGRTETEKTTISNRSIKLFTLSGIYQATGALLSKRDSDEIQPEERELAIHFWNEVCCVILEWSLATKREVSSAELRRDFVHSHTVVVHAIGMAGRTLLLQHPDDWRTHLASLRQIDWSRTNSDWQGRAVVGTRMSKAWQNIQLTAIYLKQKLHLDLTPSEQQAEDSFLDTQHNNTTSRENQ